MQVKDIMTENPAFCTQETQIQKVARLMVDCDCGEIPLVENENNKRPVGVVTDRDIVCRLVAEGINPLEAKAGDCMSSPPVTVSLNANMIECLELMERHRIRRILVVDEKGQLCGVVAQADIARYGSDHQTAEVVQEVSSPTMH